LLPDACLRLAKTFREMRHLAACALIRYSSSRLFAKLRDRDAHCLARTARTPQLPSNLVTRGTRSPDSTPHRASPHAPRRARIALVSPNMGIFVSTLPRRRHEFPSRTRRTRARPRRRPRALGCAFAPASPFTFVGPAADPRPVLPRARLPRPSVRRHGLLAVNFDRSPRAGLPRPEISRNFFFLVHFSPKSPNKQTDAPELPCLACAGPASPRAPSR